MLDLIAPFIGNIVTIITVLIGAIAGAIGKAYFDKKNLQSATKENKKRLAKALQSELKTLIKIYDHNKLAPWVDGQDNRVKIVKIDCNYLTVFENNTDKLGALEADDIDKIVEFYTFLKSFIDTLQVLSIRWDEYARYQRAQQANISEVGYATELECRYIDVKNVHNITLNLQDNILNNCNKIIDILNKYN
jgi:hypothetical protein